MITQSYRALVVLVSSSDRTDHQPRYEQMNLMVNASSPEEAYDTAERHGSSLETVRRGEDGLVRWSLLSVLDVRPVTPAPVRRPRYAAAHMASQAV
ncbi:DUF4288 domain-containing protein [Allokutzneria oryzae]|uniref:DUF4288 domain-containing protein n=1 Tax=Allokutzneria oryzae TaxID=1378989 RepID=A0ABV6A286_9PSEU